MNKREEVTLTVLPNGVIQVLQQTIYTDEFGNDFEPRNHRGTLAPGDFAGAEEMLGEHELAIVMQAWTEEVIAKYKAFMLKQEESMAE